MEDNIQYEKEKYEKEIENLTLLIANLECGRDHNCCDCEERNHILTCQERYLAKRLLAHGCQIVSPKSKVVSEAEQKELITKVEKRTAVKVLSDVYELLKQYDMDDLLFELIGIGLAYNVGDDFVGGESARAD